MRCVTDTNVVSGLLWLGNPGRLLGAAANDRITLYTSPFLVTELRSTLSYNRLAKYVQRSGLTLMNCSPAISTSPSSSNRWSRDDHVLAAALAARADIIVTGDDDLLTLKTYQDIPIVTATEAMRRIETQR